MKAVLEHNTETYAVDLMPDSPGKSYRVRIEEQTATVEILRADNGTLDLLVDGRRVVAHVSSDHARRWVTIDGQTIVFTRSSGSRKNRGGHAHAAGELTAPMPGQVRAVSVSEGETVSRGQTLLLLEAMKMEIRIQASKDGTVKKLLVKQGQTVEKDQVLVEMDEH